MTNRFSSSIIVVFIIFIAIGNGESLSVDEIVTRLKKLEAEMEFLKKQLAERMQYSDRETVKERKFSPLVITSHDNSRQIKFGGRLMLDAALYDDDITDFDSGSDLRRARIYIAGNLSKNWDFKFQYEFIRNDDFVKDAWVGYSGFSPLKLQIGQFMEPFGLEAQTSNKFITFMERAQVSTMIPFRSLGIGINTYGKNWSFASGLFGKAIDDTRAGDERFSTTGRVTYTYQKEKNLSLLHFGVNLSHRRPHTSNETVRYSGRPGSIISNKFTVDTRRTATDALGNTINTDIGNVNYINLLGLESAFVAGPFSVQAEYIRSHIERDQGMKNFGFDGWYVFSSYFLTGESRPYNSQTGLFGRIYPNKNVGRQHGLGAWELGLRYGTLNLNDSMINGGKQHLISLGVNWYVNEYLRFLVNYIFADIHNVNGEENPNLIQFRTQVEF